MHLSRRDFLRAGAQGALVLGLARLELACGPSERSSDRQTSRRVAPRPAREPETYRSWEDVYRQAWTWDRVVKVTHTRANCIAACSWNAFVKDGIVWREEQNAIYEPSHPSVPDMNPRGCQKGACFSQLMVEPSRVKYPLRRVGERGSGRWERVSWEAALREIADRLLDVALRDGPDCVVYDHGTTNIDFGTGTGAELRFFQLFGATIMDSWAGVGDLPMGAIQTWGHFNADGSSDDWFRSDYYVIWLANPVYTRIPDVHFVWEARYRGATVVSVAPDYNASSIHADLWLAPRVGTDAALALSLAQVIVSEKLYDADYVREQTDLPFLVREDTGRYLRESDLERGGREEVFYFWDERTQKLAEAPGSQGHPKQTLALGGVRPALHGSFVVRLADGGTARVTPLFERLARHLETFTPEKTREVTGVSSSLVRKVARDFARARRAMIFASWGSCKHYHSDLVQRALCLLVALTGNQGKSGGGVRPGAWYSIDGLSRLAGEISVPFYVRLWARFFRPKVRDLEALLDRVTRERAFTATLPFLYVHGGMKELVDRPDFHDSSLPRPFVEYVREATEKGWMPVSPPPDRPPRVYFFTGANPLRRWPVPQVVRRHLWPKLELVVSLNFRMSSTGLEADFVLPAAGYYEKIGIKYPQSLVPYIVFGDKAVEPLGESKSEWEVMTLLARAVQERARERGIVSFVDRGGSRGTTPTSTKTSRWSGASTKRRKKKPWTGSCVARPPWGRRGGPKHAGPAPCGCVPSGTTARTTRSAATTRRGTRSTPTDGSSKRKNPGPRSRGGNSSCWNTPGTWKPAKSFPHTRNRRRRAVTTPSG
ncbi:MAG: hypothetical protein KatS3mg076_1409 [Candidatus Binatia bacterium]|nr:MAG: hypothetical protein KatS3mg076_1409 [Candidatus Binatia bacterium]